MVSKMANFLEVQYIRFKLKVLNKTLISTALIGRLAEAVVQPLKSAEDVDDNEAKTPDEATVAENFQRIEEETAEENAAQLGGEAAGLSLPRIPDQLYLGPPRFGGDCR